MRYISILFFLTVLLISASSFAEEKNKCKLLGDKLFNCTPFECDTASPADKNKTIHNKIVGVNANGECVHEQSDTGGDKVLCRYSEESRKFISLRIKKYNTDLANMPQTSELEENILADIFHNECDVSSPNEKDDKPEVSADEPSSLDEADDEQPAAGASEGAASMDDDRSEQYKKPAAETPDEAVEDNGDLTEGSANLDDKK